MSGHHCTATHIIDRHFRYTYLPDAHLHCFRCAVERVETAIERVHDEQAKTTQLLAALVNGLALQQPSSNPPPFDVCSEDGSLNCTFRLPVQQKDNKSLTTRQPPEKVSKMTRRKPQTTTVSDNQPMQVYAKKSTALCKDWCSCACHTKNILRVKQPNVVGSLSVAYSGLPWVTAGCDQKSCRSRSVPSVAITVQFPSWAWKRYLSTSFCYTSLTGPEVNIKIPRIVDWTSALWGYGVRGNLKAIQQMFSVGDASPWDVQAIGGSVLHYAAERGYWELCKFLADQGAILDAEDDFTNTPTSLAWEKVLSGGLTANEESIVASIFANTDYLQTRQFTILHKIVLGLIPRDLESELDFSTRDLDAVDASGRTCLSWAATRGDEAALTTLLAYGADVDLSDGSGNTPLHHVKNVACCNILLASGANLNARNSFGHTALHMVCRGSGFRPLLERLVAAGIDINAQDASGETALSNATYGRHVPCAIFLLEHDANVDLANGPNGSGDAPVHMATMNNVHKVLQQLLERGAVYTKTVSTGQTILHIAARLAESTTVEVMRTHGLRGIHAEKRDHVGKTARDYLEEREETDEEFRALFEDLLESIEGSKGVVEMDGIAENAKLASRLAALDLTKGAVVTCYTPLSSEDEEEFDDVLEELYPSRGAPVFFDALEEVHDAPQAVEILV